MSDLVDPHSLYLAAERRSPLNIRNLLSSKKLSEAQFRRHPLGFIHVELSRIERFATRLHIWSDTDRCEQTPYLPIHNHKFDLVSRLLVGYMTNRVYSVTIKKSKGDHRLYDVTYDDQTSVLTPTETLVEMREDSSEEVFAPETYEVRAGVFHESVVRPGVFTATLAFTRDAQEQIAINTVAPASPVLRFGYERANVLDTEKESIINKLQSLIPPD